MKRILLVAFLVAPAILPRLLHAQMPRTIAFQGILTDSLGNAKPDGLYRILFSLYDVNSGGSALWSEEKLLTAKRGFFSTILGDLTPIGHTIRFDRQMWLGIALRPDPELSPRVALTSVASSFFADSARAAGSVSDSSVAGKMILSGQVVRSLNGLHDAVVITGQGGTTVTSSNDTIFVNGGSGSGGTGIQGIQNTNNTLDILNPNGPTATINVKASGIGTREIANNAITPAKVSATGATSGQAITYNGSTVVWGSPTASLGLPFNGSTTAGSPAFQLANSGSGPGVWVNAGNDAVVGQSSNAAKSGVWGDNTAGGTGVAGSSVGNSTAGVWGSNSAGGYGVRGTSASGLGIYGQTSGTSSSAVYGSNTAFSGLAPGVYGSSASSTGAGVYGTNNNGGNSMYGLMTGDGHAGRFEINNAASTNSALFVTTNGTGPAAELHGNLAVTGKLTVTAPPGTGSLTLPYNSINSTITSDEAGAVQNFQPGTSVYLSGTPGYIIAKTFTAPANGYAVVLAGGLFYAFKYLGYLYTVDFGLSTTAGDITTYNTTIQYDFDTPDGNLYNPLEVCGVFAVTAGLNTVYFNGKWSLGHGTNGAIVYNPRITLLYFPTEYGGVALPLAKQQATVQPATSPSTATYAPAFEKSAQAGQQSVKPGSTPEINELRLQIQELKRQISALQK